MAAAIMPEFRERPCFVCGEMTLNDRYCRDCYLESLFEEWLRCPCGQRLLNPDIFPKQPHEPTCPHEETGAYDPVATQRQGDEPR